MISNNGYLETFIKPIALDLNQYQLPCMPWTNSIWQHSGFQSTKVFISVLFLSGFHRIKSKRVDWVTKHKQFLRNSMKYDKPWIQEMILKLVDHLKGHFFNASHNHTSQIFTPFIISFIGTHEPNRLPCSHLSGFIAQWVRALHWQCTGHGFKSHWKHLTLFLSLFYLN